MIFISMTAKAAGADREGVKPSPWTSSMVRSSAMFMCGAGANVSLAGKSGAGKLRL
jgi:hypothetical protein